METEKQISPSGERTSALGTFREARTGQTLRRTLASLVIIQLQETTTEMEKQTLLFSGRVHKHGTYTVAPTTHYSLRFSDRQAINLFLRIMTETARRITPCGVAIPGLGTCYKALLGLSRCSLELAQIKSCRPIMMETARLTSPSCVRES